MIRALQEAGFEAAAGGMASIRRGQAMDWIFTKGPVRAVTARVRADIGVLDHYTVEPTLDLAG